MPSEGVVATLRAGWDALGRVDVPKAVIGGLALTAWKHARYTRDADVLVAIDERRFDELLAALMAAGFRPRLHREIVRDGLVAEYRDIWREAFPAEPAPDVGGP